MKKIIVLLFVFCLAITVNAQPRNAHQLQVNGQALSGNVSNGSQFFYEVYASGTGTLVVETTGSIDTYMIAYDEWGYEITRDDDGGSSLNARIELNVRVGETYYFNVTGYSIGTSGSYNISAGITASAPRASSSSVISLGEWYRFSIASGEVHQYRVYLGTDSYYSIQWSDSDRTHMGSLQNAADIIVGIRREDSSSYIISRSDHGMYTGDFSSYSNEHRVYSNGTPRYDVNGWYIIEVEAWRGGTYEITVW